MIDIERLKALAEAATQGEWQHFRHGVIKGGPFVEFSNGSSQQQIAMTTGAEWMREGEQATNADFIAAANPAAVLELIAEIERLDANVRWQAVAHEQMRIIDQLKAENEDGLAVIRTQKQQLDCYIKDAERYRWLLRSDRLSLWAEHLVCEEPRRSNGINTAIDAAMAQEPAQ